MSIEEGLESRISDLRKRVDIPHGFKMDIYEIPGDILMAGDLVIDAVVARDRTKLELDDVKYAVEMEIRNREGKKPAETAIASEVKGDERVRSVVTKLATMDALVMDAKLVETAMHQKAASLRMLVDMNVGG